MVRHFHIPRFQSPRRLRALGIEPGKVVVHGASLIDAGLAALLTWHDATLHPEERSRRLWIQRQQR